LQSFGKIGGFTIMATRRETQLRRIQLRQSLMESCRSGSFAPGDVLPPLHELAKQHELSVTSTSQVIKQLEAEGWLQSLQGAGTFVSGPRHGTNELFLLLTDHDLSHNAKQFLPMKLGFEERITQLGGTSLVLTQGQVADFLLQEKGLVVAGVFNYAEEKRGAAAVLPGVPRVFFGGNYSSESRPNLAASGDPSDWVYFDNSDGGYQATRHLMNLRHERIAFLGLHGSADAHPIFQWSKERQQGWEKALSNRGVASGGLAFLPSQSRLFAIEEQCEIACQVTGEMLPLIRRGQISALVAVNCHAARGFFKALIEAQIPRRDWPAVVCFGEAEPTGEAPSVVTEMHQPWDTLGREAAQLLWSRRSYRGESRHISVPMRLISRLSCRANWQSFPEAVTSALQYV
jgi:DNA-binding LacI/PurR family transcriptional regulator